ncbi:MAG: hypothetical protein AAFY68_09275, partial [Pseudomonadota bacterium]
MALSLLALPAQAATFTVTFNTVVSEISTQDPVIAENSPFSVGDTISITAEFDDSVAPITGPASTRYLNSLISLTGSIGSYSFNEAGPAGMVNLTTVINDSFVGDQITSFHSVTGASLDGWSPTFFLYEVVDTTAAMLDDEAFGPALYDPDLIADFDPSNVDFIQDAGLSISFLVSTDTSQGIVQVVGEPYPDQDTPPVAPVPLPASGWLLVVWTGMFDRAILGISALGFLGFGV